MKKWIWIILALALLLTLTLLVRPQAPRTEMPAAPGTESAPAEESKPAEESAAAALRFETTTLAGEAADESIFAGHKLTMINFFEPWCPPCVAELPDLEKLYETFAPDGFQLLGVFSTEEGVERLLSDAGVSYPVLRYVPAFDVFQTGYVPTTVFVDEHGAVVGETQIGANSYEGWEAIVRELLG